MPIKGYNFPPLIFLTELGTQCDFAQFYFNELREAAPKWQEGIHGEDFHTAMPPRNIMTYCTSFLSSAALIAKFLYCGKRKKQRITSRCTRLRELLGIDTLPTLKNLAIRNSFEHMDERLDELFFTFRVGKLDLLSVTGKPPSHDTVVLKRFDPQRLTISSFNDELSLIDCESEIRQVQAGMERAFAKLKERKFDLWTIGNIPPAEM